MNMVSEVDEDKRDTRTVEIELKSHEIPTKTATPLHTLDWYIKWVSSIVLIIGMILAANNDRSLIIVNAVGAAILINGLVGYWLKG